MSPLVQLIISQAPSIISLIQKSHGSADLTSQQIMDAFEELFASSFAKDEMLRVILEAEIKRMQE